MAHPLLTAPSARQCCTWLAMQLVAMIAFVATPAVAAIYDPVFNTPVPELMVPLNQSKVLGTDDPIDNLSVGNADVADVLVLDARKFYVVGKALGSTNVVVWSKGPDGARRYNTLRVEVSYDLDSLKRAIHEIAPDENPRIQFAEGAIVLSGQVSSPAKIDAVVNLAKQFISNSRKYSATTKGGRSESPQENGGEVINMMQVGGPHQVMLEIKVAEVSRNVLKRMGVNLASIRPGTPWTFGVSQGGARFPDFLNEDGLNEYIFDGPIRGPNVDLFAPNEPTIETAGLFLNYLTGGGYLNLVLEASKNDGLAKILAEPTLTTLSGQPASFLSGGEFPVPVWNGDNDSLTVVFKEFGIATKALPMVLDSNRINLSLNISVSELSDQAAISAGIPNSNRFFGIPSLTTRSASSTVELMDGQSIGIAGLISDRTREAINRFPGLGDLPVLGALFRSQQFVKDQTELVMFVTAHLAKPIDPARMRLPTEAYLDPTSAEFFLMGRLYGKNDAARDKNAARSDNTAAPAPASATPAAPAPADTVRQPDTKDGPTFGFDL